MPGTTVFCAEIEIYTERLKHRGSNRLYVLKYSIISVLEMIAIE